MKTIHPAFMETGGSPRLRQCTRWVAALAVGCLTVPGLLRADTFASTWQGTRTWIGPEYWANPLQDWRVEDGEVIGLAAQNRTLHLLTHQLTQAPGEFLCGVTLRLDSERAPNSPPKVWAGFRFGIRGALDDYRHVLIYGRESFSVGLRADGRIFLEDAVGDGSVAADREVRLELRIERGGERSTAVLTAVQGDQRISARKELPTADLHGNVALAAEAPRRQPQEGNQAAIRWHFRNWELSGDKVEVRPEQAFGPILWTQYTLSRGVLKLSAQFPPLGEADSQTASLQTQQNGAWRTVATESIHPLARTALFRVAGWNDRQDTPYRVVYRWQDRDYHWPGTVRRDPADKPVLVVAAFTGDNGYVFPQRRLVRNLGIQNPDVLFFSGDQIYESYGGFGVARNAPVAIAMLDYLRKFYQFGWTWREILKDRPVVILPDDHDVFQGNLWGQGGRAIPNADGTDIQAGGYTMPPDWVNAVQRTQTGHLPDSPDPASVEQGITTYFTDMVYGRVSFAVLEDRKFKTGPHSALKDAGRGARQGDPKKLDVPGAQLLGERQERFLRQWAADWAGADMKVALSQTIFCKVTTHAGQGLKPHGADLDSGAWPQSGRNRALAELRRAFAFSIHGDQHSGALVHHGIDDWEDANVAFMVVGTANGFPRAWWPEKPGENRVPGRAEWTGRFTDDLGNKITVLAAANPEPGANQLRSINPEELAQRKGSGHGIARFDKNNRTATFEMWHHGFDAANPKPGDQFQDFPQTYRMEDNYARQPTGWLPRLEIEGVDNPVVQIYDETTNELVYCLRIKGRSFVPPVFSRAPHKAIVGEGGRTKAITGLQPLAQPPGGDNRVLVELR